MNTQTGTSTSSSTPKAEATLSAAQLDSLASAYGSTDAALARRALAVHDVKTAGITVKIMCRDLSDAARLPGSKIDAPSEATLGFAAWAGDVAVMVGVPLKSIDVATRALMVRANKRRGKTPATAEVSAALRLIDKDKTGERLTAVIELCEVWMDNVKPAPKARAVKSAHEGDGGDTEPADAATPVAATPRADVTPAAALHAIRLATKYLAMGGTWTADIESAVSGLRDAATAARKRTRPAVPTVAPALPAVPVAA